ncbi:MAG: glycoside hydrolase family 38 C-terminal domain-containing protein [Candidatus Latescibacterota bacterium]|jgi:alpha-mannosidase
MSHEIRPPVEEIVSEREDFPPLGAEVGPADLSRLTLVMAGHAHIDLGYRWDLKETIHRIAPATFRGVLAVMEQTPGFTFCQSQMFLYQAMEEEYPELFARIRRQVETGAWEVIGGAWCEYDALLPSGEAVIRQHLQGARYALDHLGVEDQTVAFFPDSFIGHAATLPQILSGCGCRYYLFTRGLPRWPGRIWRAFRWVGPDDSEVIAYRPFGSYGNPPLTPRYLESLKPFADTADTPEELALYGAGDHGGGPREDDLAALRALSKVPTAPAWRFGAVQGFFDQTFPWDRRGSLPEYRGTRDCFATGALTSQAQIKRRNRLLEHRLVSAEALAAIGAVLQRKPAYPRLDFIELWQRFLTLQFHDILPGTSVAAVYSQAHAWYDQIEADLAALTRTGLGQLQVRLDTRGEGYPLLVYNPTAYLVEGLVEALYPAWVHGIPIDQPLVLLGPDGTPVPACFDPKGVTFRARVPSFGYGLFRVTTATEDRSSAAAGPRATFDGRQFADRRYRLTFDPASGDLLGLEDRVTGLQLLAGPSNRLVLHEEEEQATSWVQAFTGQVLPLTLVEFPHLTESGPFRAVVTSTSRTRWSTFTREVILTEDGLDFRLFIDWHETDAFLKLTFTPRLDAPRVTAAIGHGSVEVARPEREFCIHEWVDLSDEAGGQSFLTDAVYGADLIHGTLGLSVIRTVRDMDPEMAHGPHEVRYALRSHEGPLVRSSVSAEAHRLLEPLQWIWASTHHGGLMRWGGIDTSRPLAPAGSFLSIGVPNVEVCALKMLEDHFTPEAFVVRLRELDGRSVRCPLELPLPCTALHRADHLERCQEPVPGERGCRVTVSLRPYELATFIASL